MVTQPFFAVIRDRLSITDIILLRVHSQHMLYAESRMQYMLIGCQFSCNYLSMSKQLSFITLER